MSWLSSLSSTMRPMLTFDSAACARNWRMLSEIGTRHGARIGAAVKTDGYGMGMAALGRSLARAGARDMFVASLSEAIALRKVLEATPQLDGGSVAIYVLHGFEASLAGLYSQYRLRPCLNAPDEARAFCQAWREGTDLPSAAAHLDTGLNRLGLDAQEAATLATEADQDAITLLMTHPACADTPARAMNRDQRERFASVRTLFPNARASFANSAALLADPKSAMDLARPGIALHGLSPFAPDQAPPLPGLEVAAQLTAPVLRVRSLAKGDAVGYSATWRASAPSLVAIIAAGYADGLPRSLLAPAQVMTPCGRAPFVGSVSMDLAAIDITRFGEGAIKPGDRVEIFGPSAPAEGLAAAGALATHELLIRAGLGARARMRDDALSSPQDSAQAA